MNLTFGERLYHHTFSSLVHISEGVDISIIYGSRAERKGHGALQKGV